MTMRADSARPHLRQHCAHGLYRLAGPGIFARPVIQRKLNPRLMSSKSSIDVASSVCQARSSNANRVLVS